MLIREILIESRIKQLSGIEEASNDAIYAWNDKYSKYNGTNGPDLVKGLINGMTSSGIISDGWEENEVAEVEQRLGKEMDEWEDEDYDYVSDNEDTLLPISTAMVAELASILGVDAVGEDEANQVANILYGSTDESTDELSRTDEAPVGMFKRGLTKLGAALGSNKLKGAAEMQKMANSLYKDIEQWMGSSGVRQVDADNLLASPLFQGDSVMPGILDAMGASTGVIPKNKLQQAVLAYAKEFNRTGGTVAQQPGQAATQSPAQGAGGPAAGDRAKMAKDVEVVNMDPMILRYRSKDFHLGDTGEWVDSKSNRPAQPAYQAFLNQQADIADGAATTAPPTSSPAAPTPTAPPSATTAAPKRRPRKPKATPPAAATI